MSPILKVNDSISQLIKIPENVDQNLSFLYFASISATVAFALNPESFVNLLISACSAPFSLK